MSDALNRANDAAAGASLPSLPPLASRADLDAALARAQAAVEWASTSVQNTAVPSLPGAQAVDDAVDSFAAAVAIAVSVVSVLPDALAAALKEASPDVFLGLSSQPGLTTTAAAAAALTVAAVAAASRGNTAAVALGARTEADIRHSVYYPEATLAYFSKHPQKAIARASTVARLAGGFLAALALDRATGKEEENAKQRAAQLRRVLTQLGPTAVKVGQVLSARVDLLPTAYLDELRRLQDSVAPFAEAVSRAIIAAELPAGSFASISSAPVASASLGQVYKAMLADGTQVAVKVQRPDVAESIALDLLLLRLIAPRFQAWRKLNTDLVGLVDEWGARFVAELDYTQEAAQGTAFIAAMRSRGLADSITSAPVVVPLTSRRVLTTTWVDGTRIDDPSLDSEEAKRMVQLALAAYLTMLLDTGSLHADPHPGNLLRTPSGALVILDWGLVTPVTSDQQIAILSYIAHLVGKDYAAVPGDLLAMGFVPQSKMDALRDSGVTAILAEVFRALAKGGGAKEKGAELRAIAVAPSSGGRVDALAKNIGDIQQKYGNILQIPAYFAYILRAFSVLEGIGLAADSQFSIAQACYPYIARRLLSDPHPRAEAALEGILYGPAGRDAPLDTKRVRQLATAFRSFVDVTASPASSSTTPAASSAELGPGTREALRLALSPQGGPLQRILLRELAKLATSGAAVSAQALASTVPGRFAAAALEAQRAAVFQAMGPARWMAAPLTLPADMLAFAMPLMRAAPGDEQRLEAARAVLDALFERQEVGGEAPQASPQGGVGETTERLRSWITSAAPLLPELAPGLAAATLRFGSVCLEQAAMRLAAADADERAGGGGGLGAPPPRV